MLKTVRQKPWQETQLWGLYKTQGGSVCSYKIGLSSRTQGVPTISISRISVLLTQENLLLIHVPKTAGNSLSTYFIERSNSDVGKTQNDPSQDLVNRFGIKDPTGLGKHATLAHYATVIDPLSFEKLTVIAVWRHAPNRLLSLYYSPHRWVGSTPYFSVREFWKLAKNNYSLDEMISSGGGLKPYRIILLNFDKLSSALEALRKELGNWELFVGSDEVPLVNASALAGEKPAWQRLIAIGIVMLSKHRRDRKWDPRESSVRFI